MKRWDPVDVVILLLVLTILIAFGSQMYVVIADAREMDDTGRNILKTIAMAIIAIISMYVGARLKK